MTYKVTGIARGPQGQTAEVSWEGLTFPDTPTGLLERTRARHEMKAKLIYTFPQLFGCDPTHVEAHIEQESRA